METILIDVISPSENHLLLTGIPFVEGTYFENDGLKLTIGGSSADDPGLPIWYEVRNKWRDGSIRWIFLHSRIPSGTHKLTLSILKSKKTAMPGPGMEGNVVQLERCRFSVEENSFSFTCPDGTVSYGDDLIQSDLRSKPFKPAKWEINLLEDSPLAPLVRIQEEEKGFSRDFLIRLDPVKQQMIIHRRMTVSDEGFYHLEKTSARLGFSSSVENGRTLVLEPGQFTRNGETKQGFPSGLICGDAVGLYIDKFWQRFPAAVDCRGNDVRVEFYPEEAKPLPVSGGMSYRHILKVACSAAGLSSLGSDIEVVINARQLMDSFACEKIYLPEGHFPAYEEICSRMLNHTKHDLYGEGTHPAELDEEEKQHPNFFGLEHYGDFPAPNPEYRKEGKPTFYWDNEYDPAFSYYRSYAMNGDSRALTMGYWHAIHMSDMDVSSITGDMKCHGSGHHHCKFVSEMGHIWNDSCWLNYFFFDDIWAKEAGEKLCRKILMEQCQTREQLIHGYCFAERYTGWPLMVLVSGYEALRDESILEGARFLVDFMIDFFNDPYSFYEEENYYLGEPSEFYRSALMDGCKPFMMGIIMESLERYFFNTEDDRVIEPLKKACDFIADKMWDFNRGAFMYEWNAYDKRNFENFNQWLSCLFIRGFAFTYSQTGIRKYRDIATIAFHASVAVLEKGEGAGGRDFAQLSRSLGGFVAYLDEWRREDDQRYIDSCMPSAGEAFRWNGSIPELMESGKVELQKGTPEYDGEALVSSITSFIDARFSKPVNGDQGEISLTVFPVENNIPHARVPTINFKTCFHVSSDVFNRSGLWILTSYSRQMMVKVYDEHAREINIATAAIEDVKAVPENAPTANWHFNEWHNIKLRWQAPGELSVILDDREMDKITLDRPLGSELTRLCLGFRPGNWRLYGKVKLDYMHLG